MLIIKKTPTHHDRLALQHPPSRRRHRPARKHSPLSGIRGNTCDGGGYAKEFYLRLGQASFDVAILDIGLPDQSAAILILAKIDKGGFGTRPDARNLFSYYQ